MYKGLEKIMGFLILLILEGILMMYTAFKKWQAKRKTVKELNAFLKQKEAERKAAIKELERLDKALKVQIYNLKEEL